MDGKKQRGFGCGKSRGRKRRHQMVPPSEDCSSTVKYNEETCDSQLTSFIKIEPEQFEASLADQSGLEVAERGKIKQEDESHGHQVEMERDPPSESKIPELCDVKQEVESDFNQQESEIKHETYPDFIPPETIFLQEFPVEPEITDGKIQISNVRSLSQFSVPEKNVSSQKMDLICEQNPEDELWKCKFCNVCYSSGKDLDIHVGMMHNGGKGPRVFQEFYDHLMKYHVQGVDYVDNMMTYSLLLEMADTGSSFSCVECGAKYPEQEGLYAHLSSKHGHLKNKEIIRCTVCMKCHNDFKMMDLHLKLGHTKHWQRCVAQEIKYRCRKCEQFFDVCLEHHFVGSIVRIKNIELFRSYSKGCFNFKYKLTEPLNHAVENYTCLVCKPTAFFPSSWELYTHLDTHGDLDFQKCPSCNGFPNVDRFYLHSKHLCCNYEVMNFLNYHVDGVHISKCYACHIDFINSCSSEMHRLSVHSGTQFNVQLVDGKYPCPICNVIFSEEKLFYAHCTPYTILFPNTSKYCEQCSILFTTSTEFKQHCITAHNVQHCFQCKICNTGRHSKKQLQNHVFKEHNVQLIHCTNCLSNVKIKGKLTLDHFKSCYNVSVPVFPCPICGLNLESLKLLIDHINFHILILDTGIYQCKQCLNYFLSKYNLCAHMLNGKCDLCDLYCCGKEKLAHHLALQKCNTLRSQ